MEIRVETDWHAEVCDEGGLGQLHFEEDFLRGVCSVQSLGGHDGVGETGRHSAVHHHTVHLHHLGGWHGERNWGCNADKSRISKRIKRVILHQASVTSGREDWQPVFVSTEFWIRCREKCPQTIRVTTHREVTVLQTHCQTKLLVVVEQSRRKHRWTNHFQDPLPVYCPQSSEEKMNTCLWTPEKLAECHLEAMNFKENVDFILHTKTIPLLWGRKLPVLFTTALCVCWIKTSRPHN